jgi:glycosyltransferase involved in cell wall biosynthesis
MLPEICLYAGSQALGGTERSLLELAAALRDHQEFSPFVLVPRDHGPLIEELDRLRIAWECIGVPPWLESLHRDSPVRATFQMLVHSLSLNAYLGQVSAVIGRRKSRLVHAFGLKAFMLASRIAPLAQVPLVWSLSEILAPGYLARSLLRAQQSSGASVIANSQASATAYRSDWAQPASRVRIVYGGIDPVRFRPMPNRRFHQALGISEDIPVVGIMARLGPWKGQKEFLAMASLLTQSGSKARFVIIGGEVYDSQRDRAYGMELKTLAEKLGIADRVYFAGFELDPVLAISGLDVLVHASLKPEPFGRVILEAMACKVSVVATNAGGIPEMIEDESSGYLYAPGDSDAMAMAVQKLLVDPSLRQGFAQSAHDRFLARFTAEHYIHGNVELYRDLLRARIPRLPSRS